MKTIDAIRAILSEIDPQHIDANRDAFLQLMGLVAAYDSLAPDWSKLPEWADWYAIDANGDAYAYAYKPYNRPEMSEWEASGWRNNQDTVRLINMERIGDGIDWRDCIWKKQVDEE